MKIFRLITTILLFSAGYTAYAQTASRIVFFRMDVPVDVKMSDVRESRMYKDGLMRGESLLTEMYTASIYVLDDVDIAGTYYLAPASGGRFAKSLKISSQPGKTILFAKAALTNQKTIASRIEIVSFDDFKKCYETTEWLRYKTAKAGYHSLDELTEGFYFMSKDSLVSREVAQSNKKDITDTIFLDELRNICTRNEANGFCIFSQNDGSGYPIRYYNSQTGKVTRTGHWKVLDSASFDGLFLEYFKDSNLEGIGNYRNNMKTGQWRYYYDKPDTIIWYTTFYEQAAKTEELKSYYPDGKVKRIERHATFADTIHYNKKSKDNFRIVPRDSIIYGYCYKASGDSTPFTPFSIAPTTTFDMSQFLNQNMQYPEHSRERNIEGRVIARFTVDKNGIIRDPHIIKHVSQDIDSEALRVIGLMPAWKPGKIDDQFADITLTLPLVFKLQ